MNKLKHNDSTPPQGGAWICVARISRPQGHRGDVLAELMTSHPERFVDGLRVFLRREGKTDEPTETTIESHRLHNGRIVLKLSTCATMNDAEALRSFEILIPREERWALEEDEVYIHDLSGSVLIDTVSGQTVGMIEDVDQESSNTPLLVVNTGGKDELLVPFVKAYRPDWDVAAKTVRMALPNGLLEINRPRQADETPEE